MEAALEHGSLGAAADRDKALKDSKGVRLTPAQADRLAHARAELKRLSDWARWGGNVSREELIKAVEQLPSQNLAMGELAKKVGSMRDRWKALDALSGAAPKSLWERFDAACSAAYAPAAAHFKHLADERHANAAKAQALVAEAVAEAARLDNADSADWKHVAGTVQRLRLAWSHLGAIDRKDKKRLDHAVRRRAERAAGPAGRAAQVGGGGPRRADRAGQRRSTRTTATRSTRCARCRNAGRSTRARCRSNARPSRRLWQRFRAACDAVFASRKESAHAADAERRTHQNAKEAICARLEAAAAGIDAGQRRQAAARSGGRMACDRPGAARARSEGRQALPRRRRRACSTMPMSPGAMPAWRRPARCATSCACARSSRRSSPSGAQIDAAATGTRAGPRCRRSAPTTKRRSRPASTRRWRAGAATAPPMPRMLEQNRDKLLHEILRLEIAAGIDSGAEFARERLKLQVEALQSSLKSGQKPADAGGPVPAAVRDAGAGRRAHRVAHRAPVRAHLRQGRTNERRCGSRPAISTSAPNWRACARRIRASARVVSFVGTVRDMNDGASVAEMELEHYPGMTEQALRTDRRPGARALAAVRRAGDPPRRPAQAAGADRAGRLQRPRTAAKPSTPANSSSTT